MRAQAYDLTFIVGNDGIYNNKNVRTEKSIMLTRDEDDSIKNKCVKSMNMIDVLCYF
jgi:hypothetical protein